MKIEATKKYRVYKMPSCDERIYDLGVLPGTDVKRILKGYEYDPTYELWFSRRGTIGYDVQEDK